MKQGGVPPWHLWGSTQSAKIIGIGTPIDPAGVTTPQIVNIDYHYPIAWNFFLSARVSQFTNSPAQLQVQFDLQIGVGRSNTLIENFWRIFWRGGFGLDNALRWTTQVQAPPSDDLPPPQPTTPPEPTFCDQIVAQSLQLKANVSATPFGGTVNDSIVVDVSAYFAPVSHIRPGWFRGNFNGGELDGR